jgi:hypothetical protein
MAGGAGAREPTAYEPAPCRPPYATGRQPNVMLAPVAADGGRPQG